MKLAIAQAIWHSMTDQAPSGHFREMPTAKKAAGAAFGFKRITCFCSGQGSRKRLRVTHLYP